MSSESPNILFIDDDDDVRKAADMLVRRRGMTLIGAADPDAAWARLAEQTFDVILLDLNFSRGQTSGAEGFAMLARLLAADRDAVVVVVTGHSGINIAVEAMRAGASDFVIKPWSNDKLIAALDRAVMLRRARLSTAPPTAPDPDRLILGEDAAIERLRDVIGRVAATDAAVLLTGPAGSGKSLAARVLHHNSLRAAQPLVILSGDAIASEDELIATIARAQGGTLLVDDVDRLAPRWQPVLAGMPGDVRTITTSRLDRAGLRDAIDMDLLFRLNTVELAIPPLAQRDGDAVRLARHFLEIFAQRHRRPALPLTDEAAAAIATHGWPDDVRGLRQVIERAVLLATGDRCDVEALALVDASAPSGTTTAAETDLNLARTERGMVEAALRRHAFNISRAAAELGLTRTALYRRMAKYGL